MPMAEQAWAKVNLYLHVTGRRADGYHLLDSLVVFADVGDVLSVEPGSGMELALAGRFGRALEAEADNLVLRAARALAAWAGVAGDVRLRLEKNLPVASGIGGGSADAAAALRLLCRYWNVTPGEDVLARIAVSLGADVPVCLASRPTRMRGIGEVLGVVPALPECGMVLLNPGLAVATPAVFKALLGSFTSEAELPARFADVGCLVRFLANTRNDLEPPAIALAPAIGAALDALRGLPGCLLARMSGSGATCFALFADRIAAEQAAEGLSRPGWWVWGGAMRGTVTPRGLPDAVATS